MATLFINDRYGECCQRSLRINSVHSEGPRRVTYRCDYNDREGTVEVGPYFHRMSCLYVRRSKRGLGKAEKKTCLIEHQYKR